MWKVRLREAVFKTNMAGNRLAEAFDPPSGFKSQLTKLARVAAHLNHSFDALGLQNCGSRQQ
jgi:hypothetical protein